VGNDVEKYVETLVSVMVVELSVDVINVVCVAVGIRQPIEPYCTREMEFTSSQPSVINACEQVGGMPPAQCLGIF
jgi:hypothetical protein